MINNVGNVDPRRPDRINRYPILPLTSVLWIRIRLDPEHFGLIGSGIIFPVSSGFAWFRVRTFGSRIFTWNGQIPPWKHMVP
jgi:hypothetical protein